MDTARRGNYESGSDYVLEYGELRFTFNERDFTERVEQAATKLGFVGGPLGHDEREDLRRSRFAVGAALARELRARAVARRRGSASAPGAEGKPTRPHRALDVYYHPFCYRDLSTIDYRDSRLAA